MSDGHGRQEVIVLRGKHLLNVDNKLEHRYFHLETRPVVLELVCLMCVYMFPLQTTPTYRLSCFITN